MTPVSAVQMQSIFQSAGIDLSDPSIGIGRQLTYSNPPLRTVVIHLSEQDSLQYISKVLAILLSLESRWAIYLRYGSVTQLLPSANTGDLPSALFENSEQPQLVALLAQLSDSSELIQYDPYLLTENGHILATWDHHVFSDGFSIQFNNIHQSTQFISALNDFGAEFEIFYQGA